MDMTKSGLPQSVRKYIRLQKALIRRGVLDMAEQQKRISKLHEDMIQRYQMKSAPTKVSVSPVIVPKQQEPVSVKKEK